MRRGAGITEAKCPHSPPSGRSPWSQHVVEPLDLATTMLVHAGRRPTPRSPLVAQSIPLNVSLSSLKDWKTLIEEGGTAKN